MDSPGCIDPSIVDQLSTLSGLFIHSDDRAVFLMNVDGCTIYANPEAIRLFGLDASRGLGVQIEQLIPNFWNNVSIRLLGTELTESTMESAAPCEGRAINGRRMSLEASVYQGVENGNAPLLVVVKDVSDAEDRRIRGEDDLLQFFGFFQRSQEALLMHDLHDRILDANARAVDLTGKSLEELRALRMSDLHIGSDVHSRPDLKLGHGQSISFNSRWEHVSGQEIPVLCRVQKIQFVEDVVLLTMVQDVSRVQRLTDEMQRAQQLELVGRMAGSISHDFNNLLMVILNGLDALVEDMSLDGEEKEIMDDVLRASEQAGVLAARLMGVARNSRSSRGITELNELIRQLERPFRTMVGSNVALHLDLVEGSAHVPLNAANVTQILTNLLMNARDATQDGGRVVIRTERLGSDVDVVIQLTVEDDGVGMTESVRERIFEPLYTTKSHGTGTGLGLACVQAILETHEASIEVETSPGTGSAFCVQFHVGDDLGDEPSVSGIKIDSIGARVLVVDDASGVRRILCRLLRRRGYHVESAEDGEDAIRLLNSHPNDHFDLVLTDIMMPRISGGELVRYILDFNPDIRVLILSAYSGELAADSTTPRVRYVSKPVQPNRLFSVIRRLLG